MSMVFSKTALLNELCDRIDLIRKSVPLFSAMHPSVLKKKPDDVQWSILEIFEHLNISHGIYLRSIAGKLDRAPLDRSDSFRPGWLGNWLYHRTLPGPNGEIYKMNTPGFLKPQARELDAEQVFITYYDQLDEMEALLEKAHHVNIRRIRIPFAVTGLLQLSLGDNFRVMVAHHERHLLQAHRVASLFQDNSA